METLNKNIEAIKKYRPELWKALEALDKDYELVAARKGPYTVNVDGAYLHSRYDPIKEAEKKVEELELSGIKTWMFCGLALGYHLKLFVERVDQYNLLLLVEPDPALFIAMLKVHDFSELIASKRVYIFVDQSADQIYDFLTFQMRRLMAADFSVVEWQASFQVRGDYFREVLYKTKDIVRLVRSNVNTVRTCGRKMMENTMLNIPRILTSPGLNNLKSKFKDYAGIIVSAGPSLNKNVHLLKKAKGKMLIVSTDTALKILLKEGIKPDFVITADFNSESALHFEGLDTRDIPLIFDSESAFESLDAYKGPLFSSIATKPLSAWVNSLAQDKGILNKGMSVAHAVFNVLEFMECKAIVFIGQDLAFTGGKSHAQGTHSRAEIGKDEGYEDKNLIKVISDIDGQELLTRNDMYIYKQHFELMVRQTKRRCINATEGGAGIKGTEVMTLEQAISELTNEQGDLDLIVNRLKECEDLLDKSDVYKKINEFKEDFIELNQAATRVEALLKEVLEELERGKALDKQQIAQKISRHSDDLSVVRSKELCLRLIHTDLLNEVLQLEREGDGFDLHRLNETEYISSLREDHRFQLGVKHSSQFIIDLVEKIMDKI